MSDADLHRAVLAGDADLASQHSIAQLGETGSVMSIPCGNLQYSNMAMAYRSMVPGFSEGKIIELNYINGGCHVWLPEGMLNRRRIWNWSLYFLALVMAQIPSTYLQHWNAEHLQHKSMVVSQNGTTPKSSQKQIRFEHVKYIKIAF